MTMRLAVLMLTFSLSAKIALRSDEAWIRHCSFEDFAAGIPEDGGTNLLISRDGTIEMIHRWDFNNDGHLDLWVGQDHDVVENVEMFLYWGSADGPRSLLPPVLDQQPLARLLREIQSREKSVTRLPSDGGGRSVLVDLNNDGHLEIVFCNYIHNYSVHMDALVYWGGANGYRADRRTELPTLMASGVAAADFNRDGLVDLAFSNQGIEGGERFGFDKHLESYVYWNSPTGFSAGRRTSLSTVSASDCAAGDLDGDGYPELLFANNNSQHRSIFIYRGGKEGFSQERRTVWEGGEPLGLYLDELSGDGKLDLVVMHRDDRAELWRGTAAGLERWSELPTIAAVECAAADLDADGRRDLVFANAGTDDRQVSYVYWGTAHGYSVAKKTELPTLHASDVSLADFNHDGWTDIVFANEYDAHSFDVNSFLYWNGPRGFDAAHRAEIQGLGAVSTRAADLNRDGHQDLVLINRHSGSRDDIDSFIYWGNPKDHYSPARMSRVSGGGHGGCASIADLDRDGFVDIVFPAGVISWGGPAGFSPERRQILDGIKGHGTSVADLNRDGYLDLVFSVGERAEGKRSEGVIIWGARDGYDSARRSTLGLSTRLSQSGNIADFNRDGFLDLIFTDVDSPAVDIFWGSASGTFKDTKCTRFVLNNSSAVEIADLNADGWLDFVLGGGWDPKRFGRPTRHALVVWGGPAGFSADRVLRLEAFDSLEQAVADLNRDGYLDIVVTNYHAYHTRTIPVFIYWGGPDGSFSESRRGILPAESSGALTVADLNQDGWMEIVAFNHIVAGDHGVGANIFWGSQEGFSGSDRGWFPTFGPHFGVRRDIGNIYDRRLEERYVSAPLECPGGRTPARLSWKARTPHGTTVRCQIRTAATRDALAATKWRGPTDAESWYDEPGAELRLADKARWLQYRVALRTRDGGSTPTLQEVHVDVK